MYLATWKIWLYFPCLEVVQAMWTMMKRAVRILQLAALHQTGSMHCKILQFKMRTKESGNVTLPFILQLSRTGLRKSVLYCLKALTLTVEETPGARHFEPQSSKAITTWSNCC
jgi:hypothetical protein